MRTFLVAAILLAIAVAGMAITIILKPNGKFPDSEISHNKELRKQGVICAKEEELRLWGKKGKMRSSHRHGQECPPEGCDGCAYGENLKTDS